MHFQAVLKRVSLFYIFDKGELNKFFDGGLIDGNIAQWR